MNKEKAIRLVDEYFEDEQFATEKTKKFIKAIIYEIKDEPEKKEEEPFNSTDENMEILPEHGWYKIKGNQYGHGCYFENGYLKITGKTFHPGLKINKYGTILIKRGDKVIDIDEVE